MFTDWRGDPDERLDGPGTEVSAVVRRGGRPRRPREGAGVALPPRSLPLQRGREPSPRRRDRGSRRRVPPRHAGPPARLAPPEDGRDPPSRPARARRRLRRRHRPLPQPARHGGAPRRPAGPADGLGRTARSRPGTTSSWRSGGRPSPTSRRCSGSAGRIPNRSPATPSTASPTAFAAPTRSRVRSRRRRPSRPPRARARCRSCAPTRAGATATRSRRTASAASRAPTRRRSGGRAR